MNVLEKQMVDLLKELKNGFNVVEVKMELESEGTRPNEAVRFKEMADKAGLDLIVKIGGVEAVSDIFEAEILGAARIVAPMIESPYSLQKYLSVIEKYFPDESKGDIRFGVNIETIQAYQNMRQIFSVRGIKRLSTITVGRVDLTGSLGMRRDEINHVKIYQIAEDIFKEAKQLGFSTTLGGGIAVEALPFIKKLTTKKLLDQYETRKIVFKVINNFRKAHQGILMANKFELMWLQNKKDYYGAIYREDTQRMIMLRRRLALGNKMLKVND